MDENGRGDNPFVPETKNRQGEKGADHRILSFTQENFMELECHPEFAYSRAASSLPPEYPPGTFKSGLHILYLYSLYPLLLHCNPLQPFIHAFIQCFEFIF